MNGCVIGNGPSRLVLDLQQIKSKFITYGCNKLYRDFMPDYLISMDYSMVDEILKNNIHKQTKFYTQHGNRIDERANRGEPINFVFGQRETLDSGNTALRIAMKNNHEVVYIIGFDYSLDPGRLLNVYLGTSNYALNEICPSATMRDTQWGNRIRRILRDFPNQKIIRVNGTKSLNIQLPNYSEITINEFKEILNATVYI